jgi:hypothetical protein
MALDAVPHLQRHPRRARAGSQSRLQLRAGRQKAQCRGCAAPVHGWSRWDGLAEDPGSGACGGPAWWEMGRARLRAWRLREEDYGAVVGLGLRGIRVGIGWAMQAASRFPPIPSTAGRGRGSNPSPIWVGIGRGEVRFGCEVSIWVAGGFALTCGTKSNPCSRHRRERHLVEGWPRRRRAQGFGVHAWPYGAAVSCYTRRKKARAARRSV